MLVIVLVLVLVRSNSQPPPEAPIARRVALSVYMAGNEGGTTGVPLAVMPSGHRLFSLKIRRGVRGEEANCGHIYIVAFLFRSPPGASWAPLGLPDPVFRGFKTLFLGLLFLMVFRIHFYWVLGANLDPTWPPKTIKIDEKSMPRGLRMLTCFFDRFWIDFCSQLRPPEPLKSWFSLRENEVFSKHRLLKITSIWVRFWRPSCLHFDFKIHQNRAKIGSQEAIKNWSIFASIFDRFRLRFGGQLGAMLATKWRPRGHQDAPRGPQDAPKRPPRCPLDLQDPPKRPQEAPRGLQDRFLVDF